jgi:hypothetical protein
MLTINWKIAAPQQKPAEAPKFERARNALARAARRSLATALWITDRCDGKQKVPALFNRTSVGIG